MNTARQFGTLIGLVLLCAAVGVLTPHFLTVSNLVNGADPTTLNPTVPGTTPRGTGLAGFGVVLSLSAKTVHATPSCRIRISLTSSTTTRVSVPGTTPRRGWG